jgi:hypothetical protein
MEDRIEIKFDKRINGYVVTMPDFVTLDIIEEWKDRFDQELKKIFSRAALVSTAKFMAPIIKSEIEAYFDNLDEAYKWLKE